MGRPLPHRDSRGLELIDGLERAVDLRASTKRFVELAARLTQASIVGVSLVSAGEQVFISSVGLPLPRGRRPALAGCSRAVATARPVVVDDTSKDLELQVDPGVRELGVRAYAAFPLTMRDGTVVGTLVALDRQPRQFSAADVEVLSVLASAVSAEMVIESGVGAGVYDELSGLANHQGFMMLGEQYIKIARRREAAVVLFFVSIDRLADLEERHGRDVANAAVMDTARLLWDLARSADFVARIAKDKFAVLAVDAEVGTGPLLEDRLTQAVLDLNKTPGRTHDLVLHGSHLVVVTRRSDEDDFESLVDEGLSMLDARTATKVRIVAGPQPV